jgi:hypothetical protein
MVNTVSGISMENWLQRTQRNNLLTDRVLPRDYRAGARERAEWLETMIRNRIVILVGTDATNAFGFRNPPLVWKGTWATIPHPSGRNHEYNDPLVRLAVGVFMSDVLRYCEEKEPPRCGDVVEVASGETLTVAWYEQDVVGIADRLAETIPMSSCSVVRRCSDIEHRACVHIWSTIGRSSHASQVVRLYGSVLAQETVEA